MKKLAFLLAVLMIMPLLFACTEEGDDVTTPEETTEPIPEGLALFKDGATDFCIIRPEETTKNILDALSAIRDASEQTWGIELTPKTDWVKGVFRGETYESPDPEILLGPTNRVETAAVQAELEPGEYTIRVMGNKIVILGYTNALTRIAAGKFIEKYLTEKPNAEEATLMLDNDLNIKDTAVVSTIGDTDATLRIMSFNILGSDSEPEQRAKKIVSLVNTYTPGIVCFQECNAKQHTLTVGELKSYAVATKTHSGTSTKVYTPILYDKERYELIDAGAEWNRERYTKTNTKSQAWAVLKDIETNEIFAVVNIHGSLWSSGYDLPSGETHASMFAKAVLWREDNVRQMKERTDAIRSAHGNIPVLWTGDFNFNSDASAYNVAVGEAGMTSAEVAASQTMTGYKTTHTVGQYPVEGKSIDHIFGTPEVVFNVYHQCKKNVDEVGASDHIAIYADLKFVKR